MYAHYADSFGGFCVEHDVRTYTSEMQKLIVLFG